MTEGTRRNVRYVVGFEVYDAANKEAPDGNYLHWENVADFGDYDEARKAFDEIKPLKRPKRFICRFMATTFEEWTDGTGGFYWRTDQETVIAY